MRGYPQFSFWIPIALAKICFSRVVKPHKNTSLLIGTALKLGIFHLSLPKQRDEIIHGFFYVYFTVIHVIFSFICSKEVNLKPYAEVIILSILFKSFSC